MPEPIILKSPKFRYCAVAPICDVSKTPLAVPPSSSVSAPLNARTLPVIADVGSIINVLTPPVKAIAFPWTPPPDKPPAIVPAFSTVAPTAEMAAPPPPAVPATAPPTPRPAAPPLPPVMIPVLVLVKIEPVLEQGDRHRHRHHCRPRHWYRIPFRPRRRRRP